VFYLLVQFVNVHLLWMQVGDRIGLVRKSSGALHYFINGVDQGVATTRTPQPVWGVVDLYGMAVQVTVIDVNTDVAVGSRLRCDNSITNEVTECQMNSRIDSGEWRICT